MENELLHSLRTLLREELKPINDRLDKIDTRLDNVETRIGSIDTRMDALETRFDTLENRFDTLETRFDNLENRFDNLELKVDSNHNEVMKKLSEFESNQLAIKEFILNSDNTFRKAEVSFDFSEKIKKSISE